MRALRVFQMAVLLSCFAGPVDAADLGWLGSDGMAGTSPHLVRVVEGQGGGPTNQGVNVLQPPIGDCSAPNRQNRYAVSTCREVNPRIQEQTNLFAKNYVAALMMMADQLSAVMLQQMEILGTFFDAKEQLEVQRDYGILTAQAHKDYHPSELMCQFGSSIRSLAHTEERACANARSLAEPLLNASTNEFASSGGGGFSQDISSRIEQFKKVYCDPRDHNNQLWQYCYGTPYNGSNTLPNSRTDRFNRDVDYNATFWHPLTLDLNMTNKQGDPAEQPQEREQEEDLIALARNLYWERVFNPANDAKPYTEYLQKARAVAAKLSLSYNSFAAIAGMKSKSPPPGTEEKLGTPYLLSVLKDFGLTNQEILDLYNANPSYYAQMEILTKKIYQNPQFYTNLYDKPANVDRINATLEALQVMQLRDRYDSQVRREMLIAALLDEGLGPETARIQAQILGRLK